MQQWPLPTFSQVGAWPWREASSEVLLHVTAGSGLAHTCGCCSDRHSPSCSQWSVGACSAPALVLLCPKFGSTTGSAGAQKAGAGDIHKCCPTPLLPLLQHTSHSLRHRGAPTCPLALPCPPVTFIAYFITKIPSAASSRFGNSSVAHRVM